MTEHAPSRSTWGVVAPTTRVARLSGIVMAHIGIAMLLMFTGVVTRAKILVPVSLSLYVPPAEAVKLPEPKPQRKPDPLPTKVREVELVTPEVPVQTSFTIPAAPVEVAPAPPAPTVVETKPAAPRMQLPSSSADYLTNPAPPYPPVSKRLREEGRVLLWVLVSADGRVQKIEIRQSSGYNRLDDIAFETVTRWKFVPGQKNGVAEAMWVEVPITFKLV